MTKTKGGKFKTNGGNGGYSKKAPIKNTVPQRPVKYMVDKNGKRGGK